MIIKDDIRGRNRKYSKRKPDLILLSSEPFPLKKEDGYEISNFTDKANGYCRRRNVFVVWKPIAKAFDY
jgi:hypothetical protein